MKNLVLYRDRYYQDQPLSRPSIEDNKFKLSESLAYEIVAYLESGSTILEFVSPTIDPYNSADQVPNIILTDGIYVWDAIIIHWIKKYRVRLPDEFLTHYENMKSKQKGSIPLRDDILEELKDAEDIFCT